MTQDKLSVSSLFRRIHYSYSASLLLTHLSYQGRHKAFSNQRSVAIGTGPFKLEYWEEDKIVMKKHHHYFAKKALLDQITLSHQGEELDKHLCYNQDTDDNESYTIQAFSYLAHNRRPSCSVSDQTWQSLFKFLESRRFEFAAHSDLGVMDLIGASRIS